jgi:thiol-disulfide isomerase/thioredoxin
MTIKRLYSVIFTLFFSKSLVLLAVIILLSITKITNIKAQNIPLTPLESRQILTIKPFSKNGLAALKKQYQGQRWLLVLWSVDCPPCFKELALIQTISEQVNNPPIVIVNVDDNDDTSIERQQVIKRFKLSHLTHLYFVEGQAAKSRYIIDPSWYGELPRSYFIDNLGKLNGKSGLINKQQLTDWFLID